MTEEAPPCVKESLLEEYIWYDCTKIKSKAAQKYTTEVHFLWCFLGKRCHGWPRVKSLKY